MTGKDVARVAARLGFELGRQHGSHAVEFVARTQDRPQRRTLQAIIEELKITVEEFVRLL